MRETQRIVSEIPWSNDSFTMALTYINWETDAIVGVELLQNVGIAIICIFITTLITLGSWRGSLFVMMCVLLTCVDIAGFMHWWGITIEITSMNIVIIRSVSLIINNIILTLIFTNHHMVFKTLISVLACVLTIVPT